MVGRQRDAIHNDTRQYIVCDTCVKKERKKIVRALWRRKIISTMTINLAAARGERRAVRLEYGDATPSYNSENSQKACAGSFASFNRRTFEKK